MKNRVYHLGLCKDGDRVILQARLNKDSLSCELWKYFGLRENTKKELRRNKVALLVAINESYNTSFERILID
jgi:hypothetical protein